MRYKHYGFIFSFLIKRFKNNRLVKAVEVACRFVKEHKRRIVQKSPCKSYSLLFAARQSVAEFSYHGIVTVWQAHNKIVNRGFFAGINYFLICCVKFCNSEIILNAVVEKVGILRNIAFYIP